MLHKLPIWRIPSVHPAIHDLESSTAIEMVGRIYNSMNELITEYNKFAEQINAEIDNFTGSSSAEIQDFKKSMEQRLICKFNDLDAKMAEFRVEIKKYVTDLTIEYNEATESLTIT